MAVSEVARIREQIASEYLAAKQGLSGLAYGTSRHEFITSRMEHIGVLHAQLIEHVGLNEATAIVANAIWSPTEQENM